MTNQWHGAIINFGTIPVFFCRSHLLLAADRGGRHGVRAHARGRHQGGGAVPAVSGPHQARGSGLPIDTGGPAALQCGPRCQRLDHQG